MKLENIFNHNVKRLGGRFPFEAQSSRITEYYKHFADCSIDLIGLARKALPELPPIHFDFVLNGQVNALAFRNGDNYFIGLHTGTLFLLRLIIGRMLSDQNIFPDLGSCTDELSNLEPIKGYSLDADDVYMENPILTPKDEARRVCGHAIQDMALMFLVGHEIAHITRGHLDYHIHKSGTNFITEIGSFGDKTMYSNLERQAIECDADQRSVVSRVDTLRITCESLNSQLPTSLASEDHRHLCIKLWAIALSIVFRLFGDVRFTKEGLKASSYPPVSMRRMMAGLSTLRDVTENWDPTLESVTLEIFRETNMAVEHAFSKILNTEFSAKSMDDAVNNKEHMMKIIDYWNQVVRVKCRPYAYEF